jgi:ribosomal protein S18 acetylase RimI-like enzyme
MNGELKPLHVEQARATDLDVVVEILAEAAAWLQANGIEQWAYPPPPGLRARLAQEIAKGDLYLVYRGEERHAVGTLRFEWSGGDLWRDQPDRAAGYVHTLAIRPRLHGQRLGEAILAWAKAHVRNQGLPYLRLDCIATNHRLRRYYERLGFRPCGESTAGDFTGALFEMALGTRS